jgi:hypothetical protein
MLVYTTKVDFQVGGFADRLYGMAASQLISEYIGRPFRVDLDPNFPFTQLFCASDNLSEWSNDGEVSRGRFAVFFNLIDANLNQGNLEKLLDFSRKNQNAVIYITINNINKTLLQFCKTTYLSEDEALIRFMRRYMDRNQALRNINVEPYARLLNRNRTIGLHIRTGRFVSGPETDLPEYVDWVSKIAVLESLLAEADLAYVAADCPEARKSVTYASAVHVPCISMSFDAIHLDERRIVVSNAGSIGQKGMQSKWNGVFGDWLLLSQCNTIVGTIGRYARTAALFGNKDFFTFPKTVPA